MKQIRKVVVVCILILLAVTMSAQTAWSGSKVGMSARSGLIIGSDIEFKSKLGTQSNVYSADLNFSVGITIEERISGDWWLMQFIDAHSIYVSANTYTMDLIMMSAGLGLVYNIEIASGPFGIRPGLGVGGTVLNEWEHLQASSFVSAKCFTDFTVRMSSDVTGFIEFTVFWSLTGGNDEYDVTIRPSPLLRFGFLF